MATFKDRDNREWTIALDAPTVTEVRSEADPQFLKGQAIDTIERMRDDPVTLCTVIHALCDKQIADRQIEVAQFYKAVIGDAISDATDALLKAILDFIPSREREVLQTLAAQNKATREMAFTKAVKAIESPELMEQVEAAMDAEIKAQIQQALTRSSPATN